MVFAVNGKTTHSGPRFSDPLTSTAVHAFLTYLSAFTVSILQRLLVSVLPMPVKFWPLPSSCLRESFSQVHCGDSIICCVQIIESDDVTRLWLILIIYLNDWNVLNNTCIKYHKLLECCDITWNKAIFWHLEVTTKSKSRNFGCRCGSISSTSTCNSNPCNNSAQIQ